MLKKASFRIYKVIEKEIYSFYHDELLHKLESWYGANTVQFIPTLFLFEKQFKNYSFKFNTQTYNLRSEYPYYKIVDSCIWLRNLNCLSTDISNLFKPEEILEVHYESNNYKILSGEKEILSFDGSVYKETQSFICRITGEDIPVMITFDSTKDDPASYALGNFFLYLKDIDLCNSSLHKEQHQIKSSFDEKNAKDFILTQIQFLKTAARAPFTAPFIFHSETEIRDKVFRDNTVDLTIGQGQKNLEKQTYSELNSRQKLREYEWKVAVINSHDFILKDLYFQKALSFLQHIKDVSIAVEDISKENTKAESTKKIKIVFRDAVTIIYLNHFKHYLKEEFRSDTNQEDLNKQFIKDEYFDIIFFDYGIEKVLDINEKIRQEVKVDVIPFLKAIAKDCNARIDHLDYNELKIGPLNKFWLFPITTFNISFLEKLKSENFYLTNNFWHISDGADPLTTPYLFIYKLYEFMAFMVEYAGVYPIRRLLIPETLDSDNKIQCVNFFQYISSICSSENNENGSRIRENIKDHLNDIIELKAKYDLLRKEIKNQESAQQDAVFCLKVIEKLYCGITKESFEHLIHLLRVIAEGNKSHLPEMWEEYHYLRKSILLKNSISNKAKETTSQLLHNLFNTINAFNG